MRFVWLTSHGCRNLEEELPDLRAVLLPLAFDGLPPLQGVQDALAANRGVWLPTATVEDARLQATGQAPAATAPAAGL